MELTSLDYEILEFVNRFDSVSKTKIMNQFSSRIDSLEYRIELLSRREYQNLGRIHIPIDNTSYILEEYTTIKDNEGISRAEKTGIFHITDKGKTALQNRKMNDQVELRHKYEERIWRTIPIVISGLSFLLSCYAIFIASK